MSLVSRRNGYGGGYFQNRRVCHGIGLVYLFCGVAFFLDSTRPAALSSHQALLLQMSLPGGGDRSLCVDGTLKLLLQHFSLS
mmetsp:Transcript_38706/g.80396  ORF Transcript_38706/g.80396 Transcript_38706/m.80396 type:complete len:82 (+) Transcript_38706:48-293(+)